MLGVVKRFGTALNSRCWICLSLCRRLQEDHAAQPGKVSIMNTTIELMHARPPSSNTALTSNPQILMVIAHLTASAV
jgi:hypothetical protein